MGESGAAAWICADTDIEFGCITVKAASHLVIEGSVNVTNITGEMPAFMHVMPGGVIALDNHLDVPTFVSTDGNLRLPGKGVTISQSVSVWGTMSVEPSTSITFNGDQLTMIPDVTIATNQVLSLEGLTIGHHASVVLDESSETTHCGYALEIHGGDQGSFEMASGSSLSVGCPVTIIASSVTLAQAIFDQTGHHSNIFTEASLIRTPKLIISEVVSTGLIKLESVDEFIVRNFGRLHFEPFYNNFTVANVSSAGIVESTRPLSILSDQFEILNGEFLWPGTTNSNFEASSASVNGVFQPGQAVSLSGGFHDFVVGEQGDIEMNILTEEFKVDHFIMNGEMRINKDITFIGWSDEKINNFTTGAGSDLILTDTGSGPGVPCQLYADSVTIGGVFTGSEIEFVSPMTSLMVTSTGDFTFTSVGELQ